jgi:3D (Asp-Asp-Asp) domain-containing protein
MGAAWPLLPALRSTQADRDRIRAGLVGGREFNGRPVRAAYTVRMRVTAYSPDERSCGASADGITASGYSVLTNGGALVAADPRVLPLGSLLSIPGYDNGAVVPVLDVGGAIKGNRLDVLYSTHNVAMQWGVRDLEVTVWEYADGLPNGFKRLRRPSK